MEALWTQGICSIREIQEAFPAPGRPAYTTVQTTVYRMEGKMARCAGSRKSATLICSKRWSPATPRNAN